MVRTLPLNVPDRASVLDVAPTEACPIGADKSDSVSNLAKIVWNAAIFSGPSSMLDTARSALFLAWINESSAISASRKRISNYLSVTYSSTQ
jgi:hypothetical protein